MSLVGLKGEYVSSLSEQATITARHIAKWFYSGLGIKEQLSIKMVCSDLDRTDFPLF